MADTDKGQRWVKDVISPLLTFLSRIIVNKLFTVDDGDDDDGDHK